LKVKSKRSHHLKELEELKKQEEKKNEFFLAASHQLKSPLAIIQWCLQIVLESPSVRKKEREMIRKALAQSQDMTKLVGDMLSVVRLVGRSTKQDTAVLVDVVDLVRQVVQEHQVVAQAKGVKLLLGELENARPVRVDIAYVRQAILNVVDNGVKYTPAGGRVVVTVHEQAGMAEIRVVDTGIGIADADQRRLFTEFFRSEEAKQVSREGTGLGLVLARHILEQAGGAVTVQSELHRGTSVTLSLPIASKDR
jgi:two-component system, OmpR family, phosphate regulon sensor histidine kinase PhoR